MGGADDGARAGMSTAQPDLGGRSPEREGSGGHRLRVGDGGRGGGRGSRRRPRGFNNGGPDEAMRTKALFGFNSRVARTIPEKRIFNACMEY